MGFSHGSHNHPTEHALTAEVSILRAGGTLLPILLEILVDTWPYAQPWVQAAGERAHTEINISPRAPRAVYFGVTSRSIDQQAWQHADVPPRFSGAQMCAKRFRAFFPRGG
jgi:hypothetical protein